MKHRKTIILAILMLAIVLSSVGSYAATPISGDEVDALGPRPTLTITGSQASCSVTIRATGKTIDATLELWQGSSLIASWTDCNTGVLTLSGTASVVSGLTYTLTVSGTINGVEFTPCSVTKTALY